MKRIKIPTPTPNILRAALVGVIDGASVVDMISVVADNDGLLVVCKISRRPFEFPSIVKVSELSSKAVTVVIEVHIEMRSVRESHLKKM